MYKQGCFGDHDCGCNIATLALESMWTSTLGVATIDHHTARGRVSNRQSRRPTQAVWVTPFLQPRASLVDAHSVIA